MNLCFFSGKIVSDVSFKFIINKNKSFKRCEHFSVCYFQLQLKNSAIINVKAYDELADFFYKKYREGKYIFLYGRLDERFEVETNFITN